jgi:hypothetical protein
MRSFAKWLSILVLPVLALFIAGPSPASAAPSDALTLIGFSLATVTLGNYNEDFFAQEALIQLEKVLGMAGRVHRGYSPESKARGDTISIRRPASFTSTSMPATASDVITDSVDITLNKWEGVVFGLTDKDLSLSADQIISDHIRPAAYAIADKVDQTLAALYLDIPWVLAQTATPALADIAAVRKIMLDNRVPLNDKTMLHGMIDSATELAYLTAMSAAGQQQNTQDPSLREGSMGRLFGFDVFANQNTPTHTSGVAADATGAVDFGSGTTAVYAAGVSTIHIDGLTDNGTLLIGDSFIITGDSQRYVLTANGSESGTGDFDITFAPPLKQAVDEDTVVTFTLTGSAKSQNLYWHRNAFALATAPLSTLGDGVGARMATASDPITNLALRSRIWYDGTNAKVMVGLDILYGVKTLDCNLAVRHYDA